ncbi:retinol-binding protein pinta-like [Macrosteles quadrilineatus]|uniref:retinol-binding protein pinta-like n=1 Tax=Macrosteles quadrilineatus TaxID=74068 RepID=UPI0023E0A055|nr:retinol-binding protein pinta-like [Macrosteles quadrilineatus]
MVLMDNVAVYSAERKSRLYSEYNMTSQTVGQDVQMLKQWMGKQPHLPDVSSLKMIDNWLEGLLLLTKNSIERAKAYIDSYFSIRTAVPNIFHHRSCKDLEIRESYKHVKLALLPGLTEEGHRVLLMKIDSSDPSLFNLEPLIKRCSMAVDFYLQHGVDFTGLHVVHDLQNLALGHASRFSLQLMKIMSMAMKAYPCRIPKITLVNTPYFVDKMIAIFRPFISPKLMARVTSYKDASQLLDILPARLVPKDYGGDASSVDDLNQFWMDKFEQSAEFFALCDSLKTDERKRLGKKKFSVTDFGENGSFRQLTVD